MNAHKTEKPGHLTLELLDHSQEGIDILSAEPSRLTHWTIYLLCALLVSAFIWSFIGKSDEMIQTHGKLVPDTKARRVYSPLNGELIDVYVSEGLPIKPGDVIARIHAIKALQYFDAHVDAREKLADKEKELKLFPKKRKLMEQKADALLKKYEAIKTIVEKRIDNNLSRLSEEHQIALKKQKNELRKSSLELTKSWNTLQKFERLYSLPGNSGISGKDLNEKRGSYKTARINHDLEKNKLSELEGKFSKEYNKEKEEQMQGSVQLLDTRIEYENQLQSIVDQENKLKQELRAAKIRYDTTSMVSPDNIDSDGFLRITTPYEGTITQVYYTQAGDKVEAKTPLIEVAPKDADMILEIEIAEANRGLLKEGMPVKAKITAFPYQRYGFLTGKVNYIAPATRLSARTKKSVYKGRVHLNKTAFTVDAQQYPLRYGMTAIAEIAVRERRIIDLALDPLRGVSQ